MEHFNHEWYNAGINTETYRALTALFRFWKQAISLHLSRPNPASPARGNKQLVREGGRTLGRNKTADEDRCETLQHTSQTTSISVVAAQQEAKKAHLESDKSVASTSLMADKPHDLHRNDTDTTHKNHWRGKLTDREREQGEAHQRSAHGNVT